MTCWYCRGEENDENCFMCQVNQGDTPIEQENAALGHASGRASGRVSGRTSGRSSFTQVERPTADFDSMPERPAATYLAPYTSKVVESDDDISNEKPVRPKSFTGTSRSAHDDAPYVVTPRYPSDTCDFDFTDEGGPIISFIRSSGISGHPRDASDSPRFGSIEIVRTHTEQ